MFDYHVHSNFSGDSDMSMEAACEQAILLGLKEIAFTDHVDYDYPTFDTAFMIDYDQYMIEFSKTKEKYKDRLKVVLGVELGIQPHVHEESKALLQKYDFDFVIASTHCVDRLELHVGEFCHNKTREQAYIRYLEDVLHTITTFDNFNVYGHIDLIRRYGGYQDNCFHPGEFSDLLDQIMLTLIKKEKGLELNMSGYRYNLNSSMPPLHILKRFKELGGEMVTIGSDAHTPEFIAHHFDEAYEILQQLGFRYITTFEKMKPIFVPLNF